MTLNLQARIAEVRERIERARERAGGGPVTLVAVTKTHPPGLVEAARAAGLAEVGENRVDELEGKVAEVGREALRWHLIGRLQRNKVRRALPLFDLLHSVDSVRLAKKVSEEAERIGRTASVLVQVNTSGEEAKGGFEAPGAAEAVAEVCSLPALRVEGLMTMAPFTEDEAVLRRTFSGARALFERCGREVPGFQPVHLSMGMSNDFEIAVEEGSTLVRLGSVLFGEREKP